MRAYFTAIILTLGAVPPILASEIKAERAPPGKALATVPVTVQEAAVLTDTERGAREARLAIAQGKDQIFERGMPGPPLPEEQMRKMRLSYVVRERVMKNNGIELVGGGGGCDPGVVMSAIDYQKGFESVMDPHLRRKLGSDYRQRIQDEYLVEFAAARKAAGLP